MIALSRVDASTLAAALGLPCLTSLALMFWAPSAMSPTTFAIVATLFVATGAIVINTFRNAQGTGSIGQLLYETDTATTAAPPPPQRTRWDRWVKRYDKSAALGRRQAVLALSVSVTLVIVWAWLT